MMNKFDDLPTDIAEKLGAFELESEAKLSTFFKNLADMPPPPELFHYTDYLGLKGILETGQLWLTDIFNLNDPSELDHGISIAAELLNSIAKDAADERPEIHILANRFAAFRTEEGLRKSAHYFVCAFSLDGDDLGQWRAYADNGRGFRLGFEGGPLENAFQAANVAPSSISTFPVTYNDEHLREMHQFSIEKALPLVSLPLSRQMEAETLRKYMQYLPALLALQVIQVSLHFKHECYNNEKEYRFLKIFPKDQPPHVERRVLPNKLIRYLKFDWRKLAPDALRTIWIGPAADGAAEQFVRDYLRKYVPDVNVEVKRSALPYRA
jgi:Protein of unknown function (DUF2971)